MKQILSALTAVTMLFSTASSVLIPTPPKHIVCVDAGHGGNDPGAMNGDITEAEETLDIATRLKSILEEHNYSVVMTRTNNNITLSNSDRADICNKNHADIAIAIHLNSNPNETLDYTQGLYGTSTPYKDKKFAETLHESLAKDLNIQSVDDTDFGDNFMQKANMPATLQETVFISNSTEYDELTDGTGNRQQQIAQALFDGINTWFSQQKK